MVDFDTWNNTLASEIIDEVLTSVGELAGGFVEKNDAVDIIFDAWCGKEYVAIIASIIISILDI